MANDPQPTAITISMHMHTAGVTLSVTGEPIEAQYAIQEFTLWWWRNMLAGTFTTNLPNQGRQS
jgi:hypothetical protein